MGVIMDLLNMIKACLCSQASNEVKEFNSDSTHKKSDTNVEAKETREDEIYENTQNKIRPRTSRSLVQSEENFGDFSSQPESKINKEFSKQEISKHNTYSIEVVNEDTYENDC